MTARASCLQLESTSSHGREEQSTNGKAKGVDARLGSEASSGVSTLRRSLGAGRAGAGAGRGTRSSASRTLVIIVLIIVAGDDAGLGGSGDGGVGCLCSLLAAAAEDVGVGGAVGEEALCELADGLVEGDAVEAAAVVVAHDLGVTAALLHDLGVVVLEGHGAGVVLVGGVIEVCAGRGDGAGGAEGCGRHDDGLCLCKN